MKKIKIVIADDHPLILRGTKHFLTERKYIVIGTANNGLEAYNQILNHQPDIAILDYNMPKQNGIEVAKTITTNKLQVKVVILSLHKQEALLNEVGNTIHGYLTKDTAISELENCIEDVLAGRTFVSESLKDTILFDAQQRNEDQLTVTERKILEYIAKNNTSKEIAEELYISRRTVEKHRSNIIKKLGLESKPTSLILWLKNHPHFLKD